MPYNMNGGYGRLATEAIQNAVASGGKVLLVGAYNTLPNYFEFSSMLGNDPDGTQRFFSGTFNGVTAIQQAVNATTLGNGDVICLLPGAYDESVVVPRTKGTFTMIGLGGRGDVGISPSAAGAVGLRFDCDDLTLINVGVAGNTSAANGITGTGSRFRAYGCKFEGVDGSGSAFSWGPGTIAAIAAHTQGRGGDLRLVDCEYAWSFNGLNFLASDFGVATQIRVIDPLFHNVSNVCLLGSVRNLEVTGGVFDNMEDGTKPADYVDLTTDAAGTGILSGNRFALATNAAADLKIPAGVKWVANYTEAGTSTARPA